MELRGISDIEGKAAMGSGERAGKRASFKSVVKKIVKKNVLTPLAAFSKTGAPHRQNF